MSTEADIGEMLGDIGEILGRYLGQYVWDSMCCMSTEGDVGDIGVCFGTCSVTSALISAHKP